MRRVAPILGLALITAGVWIELTRVPADLPVTPTLRTPRPRAAAPETSPAASRIVTRPIADTPPEAAESAPASRPYAEVVLLEVVREDGRPIANASVEVRHEGTTQSAVTNASGEVEIPALPGVTADVEVWGDAFRAITRPMMLDPGRQRFVVPTGARVAGIALVRGSVPTRPLTMYLTCEPLCARGRSAYGEHAAATGPDGGFEFYNLPRDWRGTLMAEDFYFIEGVADRIEKDDRGNTELVSTRSTELPAPADALTIRLVEIPGLRGRLVTHGTRDPIAGGVNLSNPDDPHMGIWTFTAWNDGCFRIIAPHGMSRMALQVADLRGLGSRDLEVFGPFDPPKDVGDVELAPVRHLRLRVRDRDGAPLVGAFAAVTDTRSRSEATDDTGATEIMAHERGGEIRVAKLGYATTTVRIPDDVTEPIDVVLIPGNRLTIEVQVADGSTPADGLLAVVLSSSEPMFAGPHAMSDDLLEACGATDAHEETGGDEGATITFLTKWGRPVVVAGFRPGVTIDVELRGQRTNDLTDRKTVTLPAQGAIDVVLRATASPQSFHGRVRTIDGAPIDSAQATFRVPFDDRARGGAQAGAEGLFEIHGIFAHSVDVDVVADGFAPLTESGVPIPPAGAVRDFILTPLRDVTVALVSLDGGPVTEAPSFLLGPADGDPIRVALDAEPGPTEGTWILKGLMPGPLDLVIQAGIAQIRVTHDTRLPYLRVTVPSDGVARITWRRLATDSLDTRLAVYALPATVPAIEALPDPADPRPAFEAALDPGVYFAAIEQFDEESGAWVPLATSPTFDVVARAAVDVTIVR